MNKGQRQTHRSGISVYQFYQQISPYYFNTRQLSLDITDYSKKKPEKIPAIAFFIEDVDSIAERNNATEIKGSTLVSGRFNPKIGEK